MAGRSTASTRASARSLTSACRTTSFTLLQRNLLLSHAVGVGEPVPPEITHVMLRLKIHGLGLGYSGVSLATFRRLLDFDRLDLVPSCRVAARSALRGISRRWRI